MTTSYDCLVIGGGSGGIACECEDLLWAFGQSLATASLGLDATSVGVGDDSTIPVDTWRNTGAPGVYATGDVTGRVAVTPVVEAAVQGSFFVCRVAG